MIRAEIPIIGPMPVQQFYKDFMLPKKKVIPSDDAFRAHAATLRDAGRSSSHFVRPLLAPLSTYQYLSTTSVGGAHENFGTVQGPQVRRYIHPMRRVYQGRSDFRILCEDLWGPSLPL